MFNFKFTLQVSLFIIELLILLLEQISILAMSIVIYLRRDIAEKFSGRKTVLFSRYPIFPTLPLAQPTLTECAVECIF